jgi:cysteine desulfurase
MAAVYLDNQATTPLDPRVLEAMLPYFSEVFGNPHSQNHRFGWDASEAVRQARHLVARLINAADDEIIFTSGATEACNLAIRGVARASAGDRTGIVTVATEHPCVLETCKAIGQHGFNVKILPVAHDGLLDLDELRRNVDDRTLLVSVMAANNEIGVLQPIQDIAKICADAGAYFHSDASQAVGRSAVDVQRLGVDLMSLSGHKLYGPKGIGALFVRRNPRVAIAPIVTGGGQEKGLRPGTVPVALTVGLGEACRISAAEMQTDGTRINGLTQRLVDSLVHDFPGITLFGHRSRRIAGSVCVGFRGHSGDSVAAALNEEEVAVSTGAACSSQGTHPSHVLLALGVGAEEALTAVRISIGRFNSESDIDVALEQLRRIVRPSRRIKTHAKKKDEEEGDQDQQRPNLAVRAGRS